MHDYVEKLAIAMNRTHRKQVQLPVGASLVTFDVADKRHCCSAKSNSCLFSRMRSKEWRRMVCDCTLTKEEIGRGETGCGEDCLNRLLMIEW